MIRCTLVSVVSLLILTGCATQPEIQPDPTKPVTNPVALIAAQAAGGTLQMTDAEDRWLGEIASRLGLPPITVVDNAHVYAYVVGQTRTLVSAGMLERVDGQKLAAALAGSYRSRADSLSAPDEASLVMFFPMLPHVAGNAQRIFVIDSMSSIPAWPGAGTPQSIPPSILAWSKLRAAGVDPSTTLALDASYIKDRAHAEVGYRAMEQGDIESALRAFRRATQIHPEHFRHWLALGAAAAAAGHILEAKDAYARSAEILPTADAFVGLAEVVDDPLDRLDLLEQAARAPGPGGQKAGRLLAEEYFAEHANRFIGWLPGLDSRGRIYVELNNRLPIMLEDVVVTIFCDGKELVRRPMALPKLENAILLASGATSPACLSVRFD